MTKEKHQIPWLSHQEYNHTLRTVAKHNGLSQRLAEGQEFWYDQEEVDAVTRTVLLAEQYNTNMILAKNGLSGEMLPHEIPGVNTVQNKMKFSKKENTVFNITVTGMPRAGKDTLLGLVNDLQKPGVMVTQEPHTSVSSWEKFPKEGTVERQQYIHGAAVGEYLHAIQQLRRRFDDEGIIIHNRGLNDNTPFGRARLLDGDIFIPDYYDPEKGWWFRVQSEYDATIFCLQHPSVSMERRLKKDQPGRYLNPTFLQLLYEQYLREYILMKNDGKKNIVILDTSGTVEENFALMRRTLNEITGVGF
ncbi:MAG: hypothetical protein QG639_160 [Patescibacteria group bacterium]|nr:hypothetical protein [Patescibacteria group bacterium]